MTDKSLQILQDKLAIRNFASERRAAKVASIGRKK